MITKHINNIFKEDELEEKSNVHFLHIANSDKPVKVYNLDVIISVGYRAKSKNGIIFRKWATKILKDYMLQGYAVNQKQLEYLEKTVKLIDIANRIDERLEGDDAKVIDNNTLVALTLLIAESNPKEKNIIVDLVMNFL